MPKFGDLIRYTGTGGEDMGLVVETDADNVIVFWTEDKSTGFLTGSSIKNLCELGIFELIPVEGQ
jgi:hypothetical protein